ncbi:hypothetical protein J8F10_07055 [Gemmata sp. G18]|uniref:Winged helix DNA-binding domain-containing protein n=1 Tax=Gemmata palustris TaxID=2822762 RepID=A0ABS5BMX0_9BACT|nr:hypothetical protein [Gemmata palustris]MBP3955039.1 hypothetical protein [Gemmata palustris]
MSELPMHLNELEAQFAGTLATFGSGDLAVGIFPLSDVPPADGPIVLERASLPAECLPRTTWIRMLGWAVLPDQAGHEHPLLYVLAGTEASECGPVAAFLDLSCRAGAACYRLAPGAAAVGVGNAPELDWLNTLYSYLKGTEQVVEGAGYSQIPNVFAASTLVLGVLRRTLAGEPVGPLAQCLYPGVPGEQGGTRIARVRAMTREEYFAATTPPDQVREWLAHRYRSAPVAGVEHAPSRDRMAFERLALFAEFLSAAGHPVDDTVGACVGAGWVHIAHATVRETVPSEIPAHLHHLNLSVGRHELLAIRPTVLNARVPDAPAPGSGAPGSAPVPVWDGLRELARGLRLKGKQARIVNAICDGGGSVPIATLGTRFQWNNPVDNWNSTRKRLNTKFRGRGWRFVTADNNAVVEPVPPSGRK